MSVENTTSKTRLKNIFISLINPHFQNIKSKTSYLLGTVLGFSGILLPQLEQEGHIVSVKTQEASWIASLSNIGQLVGSLLMGVFAGAIGRKKTIMLFSLPLLVGWVVMFISNGDTILLCLGRIFQGIGTMSSVTQVYLVEVADAQRRQGHLREQFKIDADIPN